MKRVNWGVVAIVGASVFILALLSSAPSARRDALPARINAPTTTLKPVAATRLNEESNPQAPGIQPLDPAEQVSAVAAVLAALFTSPSNPFGIQTTDLFTRPNSRGAGTFVCARPEKTAPRLPVWLVVRDRAFALNGPAKTATPTLPWPRDARVDEWQPTGLDPFDPREALRACHGATTR